MRPHRWQPTRLPRPWDSPGKNTGVGCHFLLQCMKVKSESEVAQSCPTLSDPAGLEPTRLLHPWDFPGKSTGVGCYCLLRHKSPPRTPHIKSSGFLDPIWVHILISAFLIFLFWLWEVNRNRSSPQRWRTSGILSLDISVPVTFLKRGSLHSHLRDFSKPVLCCSLIGMS